MTCRGICIRHEAQKPTLGGRHAFGLKRCQTCGIFIKWEGLCCPCCGYRLRTRRRNLKNRALLREKEKKYSQQSRLRAHSAFKVALKGEWPIKCYVRITTAIYFAKSPIFEYLTESSRPSSVCTFSQAFTRNFSPSGPISPMNARSKTEGYSMIALQMSTLSKR